jgi:16S rRNA (cytosine1402-N4)-methyltransferase
VAPTHTPVLLEESLEALAVRSGGFYVDGTVGLGGHAGEVLRRSAPDGRLLATDRDPEALEQARRTLAPFGDRVSLEHAEIRELPARLADCPAEGILLDLGVSSLQLDDVSRGFSFRAGGPLDMRMDRSRGETAAEVVNRMPERELADLIYALGEERGSRRVARFIVEARRRAPIITTIDLAAIVRRALGGRRGGRIDPATRTFQALRIYINRELEGLGEALRALAGCLAPGGRLVVIAFHSLEDREVKVCFRELAHQAGFRLVTRRPVRPGEAERKQNPRSRSARLRALAREEAA